MRALILKSMGQPQISTIVLLFRYKFATPVFNSCEFDLNLVIAMQRHMKRVQFTEEKFENSCCDCPSGNREVGVWSHRAAAIWFFGYQYYSSDNLPPQRSSSYLKHLDDSEIVDDLVESFNKYVEMLYFFPSWTGNKKYKSVIISFSITTQILKSLYYIIWILFWAPLNTNVRMTTCRTLALRNFAHSCSNKINRVVFTISQIPAFHT